MAVNVIKRTWLQDRLVRPETLNGMVFQEEAGAHRFEITGYDSNGNEMAFSGTVTAIFLRPDNTDVPLTGVISNGVAQVTLSQECYQVPGRFGLAIFVNSGNTKTVVYKCIGPVGMTSSGVAASSVVQSVSTLIDRIDAAVNSIPQDYSALSKSVSATCPEMRDGSTGNPWNTDSITTKYIIKIDKSCDELILEYIGNTQAQYYVFGYSVFKGVADGTESYAARTSAAAFLDYPEKYVQTEPYVIIPVSQLGDYTHIAFVLWAKSDDTTFIPLRIATEQYNLRVTFRHASYMGHEEINNRSVKVGVQNAAKMASPLKLVHFSDLHRDVNALNRIRASAKYVCPNADNIICTGDMVANTYAEITSWWVPEIMTCIGNHDTASYDGTYDWTALTMAQRDEMYISPFKAYWGITHTSGTSYYYKDYPAAHIRLIVMDAMLYSGTPGAEATAQTEWLANLLASAITDSLHVIIAIHAPHGGSVPVACSFTKLGQETMPVNADCNTPDVVINTVATAIGNGLHFVGYICGHTHQDAVWDCTGDRSQLMYTVTCAAVDQTAQWANSDMYRSDELDAFNVLTIDTASTTIKILRGGGANTDVALRPRVSMVIDYSTGEIVTDTYASGTQDAVVYGEAQELTDVQKAQARANIGAGSAADVSENTADITANAEEITSLKSAINGSSGQREDVTSSVEWVSGGGVNATNGQIVSSITSYSHADIPLENAVRVEGHTRAGLEPEKSMCFLDAEKNYISGYYNQGGSSYDWYYAFDVPDNAQYLRICCATSYLSGFSCILTLVGNEGLIDRVEALEENPGITDYTDLTNKPSINRVTLDGNKNLEDFGAASAADVNDIKITINGGESEAQSDISLSSFTESNFRLMTNGYWSSDGKGYYMELPQGVTKVSIQGHATKDSYLAFLSSYSPVNGTRAPIVGDSTSPVVITNGETVTKNVPSTAVYLFLSKQDGNGSNVSPQSVKYTSVENVDGLINRIDGFENGEFVSYTGSYYQLRVGDFKKGSVWRLLLSDTTAEYAELKALTDASDTSTAETQLILYTGKEVIWSPQKDYEAIRYGVNGACKLTINDCTSLYDKMERKVFYCGASRDYTKLIDAIEAAERYMGSILYVDAGTYDLIDEFGADYFAGITTESMPGISLKNRIHIIFSPNSYVTCHYTGDNDKVLINFSPFNCGQYGFTLENLNLSSSRVRYAIHDERNGKTELCMSKYVNCKITHDNTQNEEWSSYSCIGGGLGSNHEVIIENCVFESIVGSGVSAHGVVYYHPSNDANNHDFAAKVTVKDNYFVNGTLELSGSRTDASIDTVVIFTNNSIPYDGANASNGIYFSGSQAYQGTHYDIKAWNNDIRQQ